MRPGTKSTSRRAAVVAAKVKTSVTLSVEAFGRLGACCLKEGMSQGEVMEWLIDRHLSGYVVQVRGRRLRDAAGPPDGAAPGNTDDRRDAAGDVSPAAPAAA
jgi:hypothetical protein